MYGAGIALNTLIYLYLYSVFTWFEGTSRGVREENEREREEKDGRPHPTDSLKGQVRSGQR
jgi:hypothetical protein